MKALILCAGSGTRLLPRTRYMPKTLMPVCGRPILDYQLEALAGNVEELVLVTGYLADQVRRFAGDAATFVHNELYASTNSMYSLWLARDRLDGREFMLLNGDVLYDGEMLRQLLDAPASTALLVDGQRELIEGEMNVVVRDGLVTEIGKEIPLARANAQSLQMARFSASDSSLLFARADELISGGELNRFPTFAYEVIFRRSAMAAIQRRGGLWFEIDNEGDLAYCEAALSSGLEVG